MQIKQGLRLIYSGSVTQANNKLASVDGGAMWDTGVDLSAYAGDDAGSTPHLLVLYDSAGKRMQGFIGASGGGETLGSEELLNPNFTNVTGTVPDSWSNSRAILATESGVGNFITDPSVKFTIIAGESNAWVWQGISLDAQKSYRALIHIKNGDALTMEWKVVDSIGTMRYNAGLNPLSMTQYLAYFTYRGGNGYFYPAKVVGSEGNYGYCDDCSIKQVTEVSTNGVHLHSTKGGVDRNVASLDSAFTPNDVAGFTFNIYSCP